MSNIWNAPIRDDAATTTTASPIYTPRRPFSSRPTRIAQNVKTCTSNQISPTDSNPLLRQEGTNPSTPQEKKGSAEEIPASRFLVGLLVVRSNPCRRCLLARPAASPFVALCRIRQILIVGPDLFCVWRCDPRRINISMNPLSKRKI